MGAARAHKTAGEGVASSMCSEACVGGSLQQQLAAAAAAAALVGGCALDRRGGCIIMHAVPFTRTCCPVSPLAARFRCCLAVVQHCTAGRV